MLDKFMAKMMLWMGAFFDWVADKTGLETVRYEWLGKEFSVNWPIVAFVILIWAAMVILPWIF